MVYFKTKNPNFCYIWEGLRRDNVRKFYDRLVEFMTVWYNILPLGTVCGHLVYNFSSFWYVWTQNNLATLA
jgi:hypothetical protein